MPDQVEEAREGHYRSVGLVSSGQTLALTSDYVLVRNNAKYLMIVCYNKALYPV